MTKIFIVIASFLFFYSCANQVNETTPTNVIYILADDLGYGDLSCLGQTRLQTPNIDRIANEGMIMTDHYSGNTVCSPSRACLMTGQHPGHVHCRGNVAGELAAQLDSTMVTLPRLFKNAGYRTGAFGKWGLGFTNETGNANPLTHGFDEFYGWKSQLIAHTYYPSTMVHNGEEVKMEEGAFVHDLVMNAAFDFIRNSANNNQPFFCYIPTAVPHAAMHAPKALHDKWRKKLPEFDSKIGKYGAGKDENCPDVINPIAGFAAMIENLDNQIGELLDMLVDLGIDDHTLIIFSSDNGAHLEGGHDPKFWNSNGDFRGFKRDVYEGGIHTPCLVRWPETIKPGSTSDHIGAFWDVLPTMAELTGQDLPTQTDGISFLPTLKGEVGNQKQHDYLYFEFCIGSNQIPVAQAIRMGEWKAVRGHQKRVKTNQGSKPVFDFTIELYNLKKDIGEENNVADQNPQIVEQVKKYMNEAHVPLE